MKDKIPVAVLGATGTVGQRMVLLLAHHPYFRIVQVSASERSQGKPYGEAVHWLLDAPIPEPVRSMIVTPISLQSEAKLALSALDADLARHVEPEWANQGVMVVSNASAHRFHAHVPLLIPEVNASHLEMLPQHEFSKGGGIVTNPNCVAIGLCLALKPLEDCFGVSDVVLTSFQAISGAGFPGVASLSIMDNLLPYISQEEKKVESEPKKIFGTIQNGKELMYSSMNLSATCVRVPVTEGHMKSVSIRLKKKASSEEIIRAWENFSPSTTSLHLPLAPQKVLKYDPSQDFPQPKLHRLLGNGMTVSIGRLRTCPLLDYKFLVLSHNTIRGAAGGSVLIAELLVKKGLII